MSKKINVQKSYKNPGNHNPVMVQRFGADPYALVYGGRVYIYMTLDDPADELDENGNIKENSYSKIDKISVISSDDLVNWTDHGTVYAAGDNGAASWGKNSWAPAAAYKKIDGKDKFFLYFANSGNGIAVLGADSPVGPFTDPINGPLISRDTPTCSDVTWLFDPAVLMDDDGSSYIYFGGGVPSDDRAADPGTARVAKLGADMISLEEDPKPIENVAYLFEDAGINKIGGRYFYSYCSNFSMTKEAEKEKGFEQGEIVTMVSDNPMGPFKMYNPVLKNPGHFFGLGGNNHHCMFEFEGKYYIAYHSRILEKSMGILKGYRCTGIDRLNLNDNNEPAASVMTLSGVDQVKSLDPYKETKAVTMSDSAGVATRQFGEIAEKFGSGDMILTGITQGSWICVSGADFGTAGGKDAGAAKVILNVLDDRNADHSEGFSKIKDGAAIRICLDSPDSEPAATVTILGESSGKDIVSFAAELEMPITGVHDIYFVFEGEGFEFYSWKFEKKGTNAPKDPEKKRPFFYIMQNKEIVGAPQPDGRNVHFLYMDMGRLVDAARLTGNLTDEQMLEDLTSAKGLKKMVNSVGVSVSSPRSGEMVKFIAQMYPATPGEPATVIERDITMDGMETVIDFAGLELLATDRELGQIRFEFDKEGTEALADVRLYLNDGFEAPEGFEDISVDTGSAAYKAMIEKSLMSTGNNQRMKRLLEKAQNGEDVTLGFIGGSITQGAGAVPINEKCYARLFYEDFVKKYMKGGECTFVKAGIGGTPSELGMIRFERDVLRDGTQEPDLIVIEFAVNDSDDETEGVCYESLVRKALALPWKPAVVLLFSVFSNDWNLQDRLAPVGQRYDLPMVSVLNAVSPQFPLLPKDGLVISKNLFFYDVYHPTNMGHRVMSDCLLNWVEKVEAEEITASAEPDVKSTSPAIGADFETVELLDKKELQRLSGKYGIESFDEGSFNKEDKDLESVEIDKSIELIPQFPYNWHYDAGGYTGDFKMSLTCKRLLLIFKDSDKGEFGSADVYVDGKFVREADPHVNNWTHCNAVIILDDNSTSRHEVVIRIKEGMENRKFTILGFGIVK